MSNDLRKAVMQDKHIDRQRLNKLAADIRANWQAHNMTGMWKLGEEQEQRLLDTYYKEITTEQLAILERLLNYRIEAETENGLEPVVQWSVIEAEIDKIGGGDE